jgi:hypothetical protein
LLQLFFDSFKSSNENEFEFRASLLFFFLLRDAIAGRVKAFYENPVYEDLRLGSASNRATRTCNLYIERKMALRAKTLRAARPWRSRDNPGLSRF